MPADSMMFVLRRVKPMKVRKNRDAGATPRRVAARGDVAAAGYD